MENLSLKVIKLFNDNDHPIHLGLIESIAELFYLHQGDLEEEVSELHAALDKRRREVATLQNSNVELFDALLETSNKYAEAILLAVEQATAEAKSLEREAKEKAITGEV